MTYPYPYRPYFYPVGSPLEGDREIIPGAALPSDKSILGRLLTDKTNTTVEFWYGLTGLTLASGGSLTGQSIQLNIDSWFWAVGLTYITSAPAANPVDTLLSWRMGNSGALLMNTALPVSALCTVQQEGASPLNTQAPDKYFVQGVLFEPAGTMVFDFTDRGTGASQTIDLVVRGFKIFKGSRPGQHQQ